MQLNLPEYDVRLQRLADGSMRIYDDLRRKFVALTPEEWVRQHFVHWLLTEKRYPASLTANEVGLRLNGTLRRCDTVVFALDRHPAVVALLVKAHAQAELLPEKNGTVSP